jgi:ubiquinol-cytochrome c reductase cytochrome b subunit
MMAFFVNFFALGYVGMMPAEGIYLLVAQLGTVYYFGFIMILTPFIGWIEKSSKMPLSISDVYSGQIKT